MSALYFTGQTLRATNAQNVTARDTAISDRFAKATDQLDSEKVNSRFAGIYLLERIAKDSPADRDAIVEVLSAYVRDRAPASECKTPVTGDTVKALATDLQAALTVIGRMKDRKIDVDLKETCLIGLRLTDANMRNINFINSNLSFSWFIDVDLSNSRMASADLSQTVFTGVNLSKSELKNADLSYTEFKVSDKSPTVLSSASLKWATVSRARFKGSIGLTHDAFKVYTSKVVNNQTVEEPQAFCDANPEWPDGFQPLSCDKPVR